ncbi:MAG: hypothetical protein WCK81_07920 [Betaproteobacteria bacterium]
MGVSAVRGPSIHVQPVKPQRVDTARTLEAHRAIQVKEVPRHSPATRVALEQRPSASAAPKAKGAHVDVRV